MNLIKPFENLTGKTRNMIGFAWLALVLVIWGVYSTQESHMFPSLGQVGEGFMGLWNEGLVNHIGSSLWLCAKAVFLSTLISLFFVYLSPLPVVAPLAKVISKFRYLPLVGISFYITMMISDGRSIQTWVLVVFMTTYFITSLLSTLKDIPEEEFFHARALGCNRWEVLWEVVIKGRLDYVLEVLRQNLAIVWMMLVTVETIMPAGGGIGLLIKNSDKFMNHGRIIALQLVILGVGLMLDYTLTKVRQITFRYSKM